MSFANKVVLITGGSSGIGAATAVLFTKEGANVVIVARNEGKLNSVAKECKANGKAPLIIKADISNDDEAEAMIKETIDTYGRLDVLVNNAGILRFGSILDGQIMGAYDDIIKVNLRAQIYVTTLAAPHLIKTKGNIIVISSVAGSTVPRGAAFNSYYVSKAGLNQFSKAIALELAPHGVRVNIVSPGPVETDILENAAVDFKMDESKTPLKRISKSVEIAELIMFLASNKSVGITGSDFVSDNGFLLNPW